MYKSKFRNHWTVIEYPSKILIVSVISSPITIINHMVFSYMAILLDRIYEEQRNLLGVFACFINKAKSTLFKTNWAPSNKFRGFVKFSISQAKMFGQAKWQRLSKWTTQTNHFHSSGRSAKRTRAKRPPLHSKRSPPPFTSPFIIEPAMTTMTPQRWWWRWRWWRGICRQIRWLRTPPSFYEMFFQANPYHWDHPTFVHIILSIL